MVMWRLELASHASIEERREEGAALKAELRRIALQSGADLFGVADLSLAQDFVVAQGGIFLQKYPVGLSVAQRLSPDMVDEIAQHRDPVVCNTYHYYIYEVVNRQLNEIALALTNHLNGKGHRAYLVPASQTIDTQRLTGAISHKLVAHLGGLGFIGKSCLLVTPQFGGRVRLATVLTDAPLPADSPAEGQCGDCDKCVTLCPVRAFTGVEFRPEDPREVRFKADACYRYFQARKESIGNTSCGLCVYACDGRR